MRLAIISILLLATSLSAQSAKVIALSSADAAEAKLIHDQQIALDIRGVKLTERIRDAYLRPSSKNEPKSNCINMGDLKEGWSCGDFVYSDDFKFIVPKPYSPSTNNCCYGMGCFNTIVPARFLLD